MPRFPSHRASPLDDLPMIDGDSAFRGFSSRLQPTLLPPGILALSENMRLEHAIAQPRKGALALCTDIRASMRSLALCFTLATDSTGPSITYDPATKTSTATLHSPLDVLNDLNLVSISPVSPIPLPPAYAGDHAILSLSPDKLTFTFTPSPDHPAPPATWPDPDPLSPPAFTANAGPPLTAFSQDNVRGATVATDTQNREMIIMALFDRAIIYRQSLPTAIIPYQSGHQLDEQQEVSLLQYINQVILLRDTQPALSWDMDFSHPFTPVPQGPHPAATDDGSGNPSLIRQPPAPWAVAFNRQLILPRGRDELLASDFGDPDTYDNLLSQLRIMPGGNDWIVAAHPYQQARAIIFYRKSIHLALFDTSSPAAQAVYEITRQLGCAARTSIATCGAQILWLADTGVHALNIGLEMQLTAAASPLSEPVQDIIDRIHWPRAHRATAAYHGNRYYLALPIDSSPLNNAILVYNFLNSAWESLDTYPGEFDVREFAILDYNGRHRLHAVTTRGYVYLLDERPDGRDDTGVASLDDPGEQIPARILTRALTAGTIEPKRFTHLQLETDLDAGETFTVANITRNPDTRRELLTFTAPKSTDYTHRIHLRSRGVSAQIEATALSGRPRFKGLLLEAATANPQDTPRR